MIIAQVVILLVAVPLSVGPFGRLALSHGGGVDLLLIAAWLFAWFFDREAALRWAVMAGLAIDLLNFGYFGLSTFILITGVLMTDYLRKRFLEGSSIIQAITTLFLFLIMSYAIRGLFFHNYSWSGLGASIFANLLVGFLLYYLLVFRFRLFLRWQGRRI